MLIQLFYQRQRPFFLIFIQTEMRPYLEEKQSILCPCKIWRVYYSVFIYKEVPVHLFGNLYFLSSNHVSANNETFQEHTPPFLLTKDAEGREGMT